MPRYDYKCLNPECLNFEKVVEYTKSISAPTPACIECNSDTLLQTFSVAPQVQYKGPGWFKTDGKY
jgi:predicted nucleic acid-binding Zn ribbon protein